MNEPVIFLGPTLTVEEARTHLSATYLPPVRQGDVINVVRRLHPPAIGIIDGVFLQDLSVWHKEILYAVHRGIPVYGASSMGALRAAELHTLGMIGVGKIFSEYVSGALEDDDEVALAHASAEFGYRKLSEPMVNVRASIQAAAALGILTTEHAALVCRVAKALYFPQRSWGAIHEAAAGAGVPSESLSTLREWLVSGYVDQKKRDAVAMLSRIACGDHPCPTAPAPRAMCFDALLERDRIVDAEEGQIALGRMALRAGFELPDGQALLEAGLHRQVMTVLAGQMGLRPSAEAVRSELQSLMRKHGLEDQTSLSDWMVENDLDRVELDRLLGELAVCRQLRRWMVSNLHKRSAARAVLDELRLQGRYVEYKNDLAWRSGLVDAVYPNTDTDISSKRLSALIAEQQQLGFRLPDGLEHWLGERGIKDRQQLKTVLNRASLERDLLAQFLGEVADASPSD